MITRFVSEVNFARVPSSDAGLGGVFCWANNARAHRKIVGQVENLRPIDNRPGAGTAKLSREILSETSTGRLPIGRRLSTCPTKSACCKFLKKVGDERLRKVCILEPEPHRHGRAAHCASR